MDYCQCMNKSHLHGIKSMGKGKQSSKSAMLWWKYTSFYLSLSCRHIYQDDKKHVCPKP